MPSTIQRFCSVPNFTQQAYRYGIALSCIGVLLNWLGVAQAYIEPIRYIGVSLVVVGSFLIISAMCRWMFLSPHPSTVSEVNSDGGGSGDGGGGGDLHVITVPMGRAHPQYRSAGMSSRSGLSKPPDYFLVTEKPPSYEEAMSMLPPYPASLQLGSEVGTQEDYLTPHQVPESYQAEGATGLAWRETRVGYREETGLGVNLASSPPAYSSQASLCPSILPASDTVRSLPSSDSFHATPDHSSRRCGTGVNRNDVQVIPNDSQATQNVAQVHITNEFERIPSSDALSKTSEALQIFPKLQ